MGDTGRTSAKSGSPERISGIPANAGTCAPEGLRTAVCPAAGRLTCDLEGRRSRRRLLLPTVVPSSSGKTEALMTPSEGHDQIYEVRGMTCGHCTAAVKDEVGAIEGAEQVTVDLETGRLTVRGRDVPEAAVRRAVEEAGYTLA